MVKQFHYFLFLQIKVRYLSITLGIVKGLIVRCGPCIKKVYIISEDKTVNDRKCYAHFCSLVCQFKNHLGACRKTVRAQIVRKSFKLEVNFTQGLEEKVKSEKAERREEGF